MKDNRARSGYTRSGYYNRNSYRTNNTSGYAGRNSTYNRSSSYNRGSSYGGYSYGSRNSYSDRSSLNGGRIGCSGYGRYNYTSEAFDYDVVPAPSGKKRRTRKDKQVVYSRVKEAAPMSLFKTYGTIALIFCFVLGILCIYASNSSLRTSIVSLQDRLVATQEDNEYLRISIEDELDLDHIKSEALKLGLQMPAEYQTVEIDVPKDSYTVQYDSAESNAKKSILDYVFDLFKG